MTVRVNKSSFSIREKLSELERPIGLKGSELMRAETVQEARNFVSAGRKNLVINGDMRIAQRGTSVTGVNDSYNAVDRFYHQLGYGTWTVSQDSDSPNKFNNSVKIDCTASGTLNQSSINIQQRFEGQDLQSLCWGTSDARYVTLSFWIKTNKVGTYAVELYNADNVSAIAGKYAVNSADTWEYKTITFPGNTAKGFNDDNGLSLYILFWFSGASGLTSGTFTNLKWQNTITNANRLPSELTGIGGSTNDYINLTGVQLEVGKNATEFEHRSYGEELALCQRYFLKSNNAEGSVYESGGSSTNVGLGMAFPVEMRTTPSVVFGSTTNNVHNYGGGDNSYSGQNAIYMTSKGARMYFTGGTSKTVGTFSILLNEASFSAEL